jgi:branched-chain amino acid transport system substrate-binding protein
MPRSTSSKAATAGAVVALVAALASCADNNNPSGRTVGEPIVIGIMASETGQSLVQPERQATAKAAIAAINERGGVDGHDLEMNFCDTKNDPNGELSCMRQFVEEGVSAVLAPAIIADQTGRSYALASKAGLPVIGGQGLSPVELQTEGVFPIASGIPGWAFGSVAALLESGATKISLMGTNQPGSMFILALCEAGLKSAGITPTSWVKADPQADPTFAAAAALAIADGVDGILLDSAPNYIPKEVTALRQAGYTGKISSITAIFGKQILETLGDDAEGILLTGQLAFATDTDNPEVKRFLDEIDEHAAGTEITETSESVWSSFQLFAAVMDGAPGVGSSDVMKAFTDLESPIDIGVAGPYQVQDAKVYLDDYPQIFNPTVQNGVVVDGELKSDGKGFVNPFLALEALKQ